MHTLKIFCFSILVHPSKADPAFEVTLVNATQWHNYGTPNMAGRLKMTWNSSLIGAERVNIELWGYREFSRSTEAGGNRSSSLQAELSYLYSLGRNLPNTGAFSFIPKPSQDYSDWEFGNIRIIASSKPDGARYLRIISIILERNQFQRLTPPILHIKLCSQVLGSTSASVEKVV